MDRVVVLHRDLNGVRSERYFQNWSNAQVAMDKDVEQMGGEIRERRCEISDDRAVYEVYSFLGERGGCGWWLTEEELEDC